ncbi:MAG: outer membrane beta-barrel protein [Bacteroidales bacterium]
MFKRAVSIAFVILAATSAAWAQTPKVEITGIVGWTVADGVSGDPFRAANGQTYDRIDPQDSVNYGLSAGFFLTPSAELGFLWRRQATKLDISGTTTTTVGDMDIDGYHGYLTYYFGDPEAKARLYLTGGLGMTHYGSVSYTKLDGSKAVTPSGSQFSTTWGAGVKVNASRNVGVKLGMQWTPTYIKSDAAGWWCDPWWGCYVIADAQYSNQFEFVGGVAFRF